MKTKLTLATLALTCVLAPAANANIQNAAASFAAVLAQADSLWVMKSAQGSLMEIALGRLAIDKAGNAAVVEYANQLIRDHEASYAELRALAERKRMAFPIELSPDQMLIVEFFQNSTSADWAKDFVQFQIQNHEKCIEETRAVIADGRDANVKEQAAKMMPILEAHLRMAQELHNRL